MSKNNQKQKQNIVAARINPAEDLSKFDPNMEFKDDDEAYDLQYYKDAIFLQEGNRDEIKYPYLISGVINCFPVETDLKGLSPLQIAQGHLNKDLPNHFGKKTREYFEAILVETTSVEIQHATKNQKEIAFSKFLIKRILLPSNWGVPLHQGRQLETYQGLPNYYNYHDYIKAWENTLIYENSSRKHSWFMVDKIHP